MIDIFDKIEYFNDTKETFREMSYDGTDNVSMIDCNQIGYNFDKVKTHYANSLGLTEEVAKSIDTLYYSRKINKYIFVEFKNGLMKNAKADVIRKLKDSLLIFCDIFNANISFTRKNALFILVYNEEKNKKKNNTTNGDEYGKDEMKDYIYGLAKEHEIRFGLERYRGLYFCDVFTYGKAEFNNVLNDILDLIKYNETIEFPIVFFFTAY